MGRNGIARMLQSLLAGFFILTFHVASADVEMPGLSMHGQPKYPPGFTHFEYVNPDAPKGGEVRLSAIGTFDSLNPFTLRGVAAAGLGFLYDTLTVSSEDEAFTEYGLIAQSIEVAEDGSSVTYRLRPEARFHDGTPITAQDVIFSFETLKSKGHPFYRSYYANVVSVEDRGDARVEFQFSEGDNRELPLIVGQLPVIPALYWRGRDFEKTTLDPPLGSGPFAIESLEPGRSIVWRRVEDYWARDLPVNVGRFNFDRIRYDYYRDTTVALEAFKGGEYDFRQENASKAWATGYDTPALAAGLLVKEEIRNEVPTGMQAFVFNTRRPIFHDRRVRQALALVFDFEWINENLLYGAYTRTQSFFSNSELASSGSPSEAERAILEPYRGRAPEEALTQPYVAPATDGSGNDRKHLRDATLLLREVGWNVRNRRLTDANGEIMSLEILLLQPDFERIVLAYKRPLERLGIDVRVRVVDTAQYQKRLDEFDFDMVVASFPQSLSPGNEQRDFWSSAAADVPGSRNLAGIKDPVVDELIELIIAAPDRESLVNRTRALDRVLLWGHYVVPHWHLQVFRVAYWNKFSRPAVTPRYGLGFDTWWVDAEKQAELDAYRRKSAAE